MLGSLFVIQFIIQSLWNMAMKHNGLNLLLLTLDSSDYF